MINKDGLGRSIAIFGCYGYIIVYGYSNNTSIAINIKNKTILYFEEDNSVFPVANEPAKKVDPTKWKKICGRDENMLLEKAIIDFKIANKGSCLLL